MTLVLARFWIAASAFLIAAGWVLSALHALDRTGYAVVFAVAAILLVLALRRNPGWWRGLRWARRRFRRWPACGFAVLFGAVVLGGVLYFPASYDALSYRIPRTLHWLAQGEWHWIHTTYARLNIRAAGCEWMMAPVLLFCRSERIQSCAWPLCGWRARASR